MFYKDFYHREMWYLNTRKNAIFLHVKISIISLTSGLSLKLYLNSLVYHRNIFGSSSKVLGNLRQSSAIFGHLRKFSEILGKCSGTFIWSSGQFEKSSEIFGRWSEIFGKSSKTPSSVCLYNKQNNTWTLGHMEFIFSCSHSISHSFAALTRSISMWTLKDKFHISARPCIILYLFFLFNPSVFVDLKSCRTNKQPFQICAP